MNRKTLIITLIVLIIVIIGIGTLIYWQSFKTVKYVLRRGDISATVYRQNGDERKSIDTINKDTERQLQRGKYVIIPTVDIYSPEPIEFEVKDQDITVEINPDYSGSYRRALREIELPAINAAITSTYPNVIGDFTITTGEIYKEGQWYATLLVQKAQGSDEGDLYRTVLKKEDGKWTVKAKPSLVLRAHDYPDIPKDILTSINAKRLEF